MLPASTYFVGSGSRYEHSTFNLRHRPPTIVQVSHRNIYNDEQDSHILVLPRRIYSS